MRQSWLMGALTFLILIMTSQSLAQAAYTPLWTTQLIDEAGVEGTLIVDANDVPHVFYYHSCASYYDIIQHYELSNLKYAVREGKVQNWSIESIRPAEGNIFIMDTSNQPHIVSVKNGVLNDTPLDPSNWSLGTYGVSEVANGTICLDSGELHTVSVDTSNTNRTNFSYNYHNYSSSLSYTTYRNTSKVVQTIEQVNEKIFDNLTPISMAIDSKGYPHIVYTRQFDYPVYDAPEAHWVTIRMVNIEYARMTDKNWGNWKIQTIAENVSTSSFYHSVSNLVLDSQDQPHICYTQDNITIDPLDYHTSIKGGELLYAYLNGSSWTYQTVDSNPEYEKSALILDSQGNPKICIYNYDEGLVTAKWTGKQWETEVVWSKPYCDVDLAFDSKGNPCLIYQLQRGTMNGAPRYGNLTYVSMEQPLSEPLPIIPITIVGAILVTAVAVAVYINKHKKATLRPQFP